MSKFVKYFAVLALAAGAIAVTPNAASAHGWRYGGWGAYWGGWGWGPGFAIGWGFPYYYPRPYYYPGPYYYYGPRPACGWARVRVWRHGHRVVRRVWRCW